MCLEPWGARLRAPPAPVRRLHLPLFFHSRYFLFPPRLFTATPGTTAVSRSASALRATPLPPLISLLIHSIFYLHLFRPPLHPAFFEIPAEITLPRLRQRALFRITDRSLFVVHTLLWQMSTERKTKRIGMRQGSRTTLESDPLATIETSLAPMWC